jgi:hypothetical protein
MCNDASTTKRKVVVPQSRKGRVRPAKASEDTASVYPDELSASLLPPSLLLLLDWAAPPVGVVVGELGALVCEPKNAGMAKSEAGTVVVTAVVPSGPATFSVGQSQRSYRVYFRNHVPTQTASSSPVFSQVRCRPSPPGASRPYHMDEFPHGRREQRTSDRVEAPATRLTVPPPRPLSSAPEGANRR